MARMIRVTITNGLITLHDVAKFERYEPMRRILRQVILVLANIAAVTLHSHPLQCLWKGQIRRNLQLSLRPRYRKRRFSTVGEG
jgi:hypothetical protein